MNIRVVKFVSDSLLSPLATKTYSFTKAIHSLMKRKDSFLLRLGVVFRKLQTGGVTSKMETRFRKSISTNDTHLVLRASLREQKRNIAVIEARLYNSMGELCTEATCTYFTFPQEKAEKEMCFHHCDVEPDEILPLV
jgi:hypothetical protein